MKSLSHSTNRGRSEYFRKWRRMNTVMTLAIGVSAAGACTSVGPVTKRVTQNEVAVEPARQSIGHAGSIASTETLRKEIERNAIAPTFAEPRVTL